MSEPDFDFLVIGGGSAGYAGAAAAARLGLKTAVIEGGAEMGGLCILRGCMPSKTLLESGHRAEAIRHADEFGLKAEFSGVDALALRERKRRLIGEFADYRSAQLESGKFALIRGMASFVDEHQVEVQLLDGGSRRISARSFLIATGSRIHTCAVPGLAETGFWTSDDVLDAGRIPASVVILGAGAIGLEVASFYAGVGTQVTVIQRNPQVLKETDPDVAAAVTAGLEKRGIRIFRGTSLRQVEPSAAGKSVLFSWGGEEHRATGEEIICALGREPDFSRLEVDRAGIASEKGRISVDSHQQCGPRHFAAGDVCGTHDVVHIAIQQGELCARNAARLLNGGESLEEIDHRLELFAVFTEPQVAVVGLSEKAAVQRGLNVHAARYAFADHGKALVRGAPDGFVKLLAEAATGRLVGAACVGLEASELIHEIVVAMHFHSTAADLARIPHYHPTLSEIWTYPAEELAEREILRPNP